MKMKYLTLKLFPFIAGLVIFTLGCDDTREYFLTEEMRNTIPFTGREKVSFLCQGDTLILISEFRVNAQYKISYGKNNQHYCYVEVNQIYFFGEEHTYIYTISIRTNSISIGNIAIAMNLPVPFILISRFQKPASILISPILINLKS